ncbi:cob(I)yrinic acid a,c-diamide adenosyltransferase [Vagococcus fessus]|uniref:Corrinoid adenosyltransferase n=1 Tax=Vagococcus fessus TaxID=120370 RepID=A0A430ACZ9_9ENTE|nr:cob(I)yrinic acid a,c-diamide adenosyltransferase [Vagococcus fessus]RSU05090.1 ATP:cob(I)alamin adenosyltransferase [Vagococcus fessus]
MRIYTKYGDSGYTRIVSGKRLKKDDIRVESYGTIDELCSHIGLALTCVPKEWSMYNELLLVQQEVFDCGSDLAVPNFYRPFKLKSSSTENLEEWIDNYLKETPNIEHFIIPGGTKLAAQLHVVRTTARRAERRIVTLMSQESDINPAVLTYINRLSDYIFVISRVANLRQSGQEITYTNSPKIFRSKRGDTLHE